MAVPQMEVKVSADTKELERALSNAEKAVAGFVAGVGAITAAISVAVKSVVDLADEMTKAAQRTGIAMEELQKLSHVADLSGVSAGQLQTAVSRLTRGMSDLARGGTSEAARGLKAIGVEIKNADGSLRSASDVIGDIAQKFSGFKDGAEKTALAMAIFGRAGAQMIPMLNGGRAAIEDARKELEQFGAVASERLGKDSERLNDNMTRLGTFFRGIATQVAERVVPALANASDALIKWLRESGFAISVGNALGAMFENLESIVTVVGAAIMVAFGPALVAAIAAVSKALTVGLLGSLVAVAAFFAANPITAGILAITVAANTMGADVIGIMKKAVNGIIGAFEAGGVYIKFILENLANVAGSAMISMVNNIIGAINKMVYGAKFALNSLIEAYNKIPGLPKINPFDLSEDAIQEMTNKYAEAIGPALAERNRRLGEINGKDYIGSFVAGIKSMASQAAAAAAAATGGAPIVPGTAKAGKAATEEETDKEEAERLRARLEQRLEMIRQSVLTEEQLLIHKYQKAQELAKQAFDLDMIIYADNEEKKLQKAREYQALREELERVHLQKLAALRAAADARSLNNLASFFSGAQALASSNGNKSFKAAKAFAIGQAILSTTAAAIQAMADPLAITPFQKFANYAMVLGKGMSAVAAIKSMQPTGGGGRGGGGGGGGAPAATGGGSSNGSGGMGNAVYINLQGQSFGRDQVRNLIEQIAAYQKDGGQVVFAP